MCVVRLCVVRCSCACVFMCVCGCVKTEQKDCVDPNATLLPTYNAYTRCNLRMPWDAPLRSSKFGKPELDKACLTFSCTSLSTTSCMCAIPSTCNHTSRKEQAAKKHHGKLASNGAETNQMWKNQACKHTTTSSSNEPCGEGGQSCLVGRGHYLWEEQGCAPSCRRAA